MTWQSKGQILAASDITRPALRNSGQDSIILMRMTDQSPGEGSLNILEIATKRHGIGQILNFLAPTQSPDRHKPCCITQENTGKPGMKHLKEIQSIPNNNRLGL
jgi:hypothetical protein